MINIFKPAPEDQSIVYLSQLFGNVGSILPGSPGILGTMFQTFNTIVLTVGGLIVVYTIFMGLIITAHEGEFLGKKWHGLWTPVRMVLGIAALIPTPSGYSSLQVIILWVILQGVGAADNLWTTVLKYITVAGSPYTAKLPANLAPYDTIKNVFQSLSCVTTAGVRQDVPPVKYYCGQKGCPGVPAPSPSCTTDKCTYNFGPSNSACGYLTYCNPQSPDVCPGKANDINSQIRCAACEGQADAIKTILDPAQGFQKIAQLLTDADRDYLDFYYNSYADSGKNWGWINDYCSKNNIQPCCVAPTVPPSFPNPKICPDKGQNSKLPEPNKREGSTTNLHEASDEVVQKVYADYINSHVNNIDFIKAATTLYTSSITNKVSPIITSAAQQQKTTSQQFQTANNYGWIFAGAYYYILAQANNKALDDINPTFSYSTTLDLSKTVMAPYRQNYVAAAIFANSMENKAKGGSFDTAPPTSQDLMVKAILEAAQTGFNAFREMVFPKDYQTQDPLVTLGHFGNALIWVGTGLWLIYVGLAIAAGIVASAASVTVLGTGMTQGGYPLFYMLVSIFNPLIYGFVVFMISLGGLLSVYVPLIPYIVFIVGAIGWLGSTIEALVAAPLVALGILAPGGQHEILGKSEPALMLLFAIFLRPVLMIFGLIAAMLLASIAVKLVNLTFGMVMVAISPTASLSPIQLILFLAAYVMLIVSILNKCFALIHIIPTRVMTWIGGQGAEYGEEGVLSEAKHGVEGAAAKAGAAAGVGDQIGKSGGTAAEIQSKQQELKRGTGKTTIESKEDDSSKGPS